MSSKLLSSPLVSAQWLADNINNPEVVVLDASWFLPGSERDPVQEWHEKRIPGARFFDFDKKIAAPDTELPHMLPSAELFSREVSELGIKEQDTVVVYDSQGMFSAPRVWWMFRTMGHHDVAVLDGGFPAWQKAGLELETGAPEPPVMTEYKASFCPNWVIDADELNARLGDVDTVVLDARSAERFYGTAPEPRPGVRSGHMPNAKSLPFSQLLSEGYFLDTEQLSKRFDALSDPEQNLIFSCGSGVTACILALAAELTGRKKLTVYDGSWTEWGRKHKYPVV
ncbi:Thiosulfate sulfurtransferase, rhodanese [Photobacterium marinum]|uniref:3-mercaptopyruvate sulfurtransferase n=1 Tax=Photobacterium marinum TaxID=1056511 RepID=L8J9Z8_9GAMM|nr:rhodanese-like domain-containing protein [Photobacterium marinum]ELR65695.1 Thiosulfate sulfurtransferase, rhodanese [Photobacterium marinum]